MSPINYVGKSRHFVLHHVSGFTPPGLYKAGCSIATPANVTRIATHPSQAGWQRAICLSYFFSGGDYAYSTIFFRYDCRRLACERSPWPCRSATVTHASTSITGVGAPPTTVAVTRYYGFQTWATDTDKRVVTYSIVNKPSWATFDTQYGHLYGTPPTTAGGVYKGIVISASDGISSASLPAFSICEGRDGMEGVAAATGESVGVPVKGVNSVGRLVGMAVPLRRARSASVGTLSMEGSDGMDGAGTPNWGWRISVPGMAEV